MVFTDCDLDGCGSYTVFKWLMGNKNIPCEITTINNFRKTFTTWLQHNKLSNYDQVFIFDLDVSACADLVDDKKITIIDHHDTHIKNSNYTKATTILKTYTSCCKLIYNELVKNNPHVKLTPQQKLLILMVDDYDCYELKVPHSYDLNIVLWSYKGRRLEKFLEDFGNGFFGFSDLHKNMIGFNHKKISRLKKECEVHHANIPIGGTTYKFVSTFADSCINEMADHILDKYDGDIGLVVNVKTKKVSFRKNKRAKLDLGKLANKLTDGGGHEYAAGGTLNENFLEFTKIFQPIK